MAKNLVNAKHIEEAVADANTKLAKIDRLIRELREQWAAPEARLAPTRLATNARMSGVSDSVIAEHQDALAGWLRGLGEQLDELAAASEGARRTLGSIDHVAHALDHKARVAARA